jgi:DNA polymerase
VVALGATAALALGGREIRVTRDRGKFFPHPLAGNFFATIHPSALLRMETPEQRQLEYSHFVDDLRLVQTRIEELRAA